MKHRILALFIILAPSFAIAFQDSYSEMELDIPPGFVLDLEECKLDNAEEIWWYVFTDSNGSRLTIEIEEHNHMPSLPEHFHRSLTQENDEEEDQERMIFEELEFKNLTINEHEFAKCKVRALIVSDGAFEPLYICDYLFVHGHYGFSIGLLKKDDGDEEPLNILMHTMLESIHFP